MTSRVDHRAFIATSCVASLVIAGFAGCADSQPANAASGVVTEIEDAERHKVAHEVPVGAFRLSVPVDLGEYDAWYRVTFNLAVGVHESNEDTVTEFLEVHEQRLRVRVASVLRRAGIGELDNAKLSELRLTLASSINQLIGQPLVVKVYLADFSVEVQ